ncbi:uncharacterized protein LOC130680992 [Manis pentadactyla]|uniref:uncharacterized protein LOC130680992 n=1 Tax=Manis pentadactyla TaxID=143292 RepID=UPI00255C5221|nr:uncharacterized protein LOC130680992 [Manis pentadactyla]
MFSCGSFSPLWGISIPSPIGAASNTIKIPRETPCSCFADGNRVRDGGIGGSPNRTEYEKGRRHGLSAGIRPPSPKHRLRGTRRVPQAGAPKRPGRGPQATGSRPGRRDPLPGSGEEQLEAARAPSPSRDAARGRAQARNVRGPRGCTFSQEFGFCLIFQPYLDSRPVQIEGFSSSFTPYLGHIWREASRKSADHPYRYEGVRPVQGFGHLSEAQVFKRKIPEFCRGHLGKHLP